DENHIDADAVAAAALVPHDRDLTASMPDASPAEDLKHLAVREHADLLVLGPATDTPVGKIRIGATCRGVLHGAPCPVLVPPRGYADHALTRPDRIGLAYDGSPEAERVLEYAVRLAASADAWLEIVQAIDLTGLPTVPDRPRQEHVASVLAGVQSRLDTLAAGLDVPANAHVVEGPVQHVLGELAARVDLLVCGSRSWGPTTRIALGGVAERLMQHASCPVLVVPREGVLPLPARASVPRLL
ncbi:MAG: universal stress protein, partial [Solirubrobacteraceae bacterium]|nr:universal stress protein [Patulibacter sp.]